MPDHSFAMNAALAQNWWALALRGVIAILFGVFAFTLPGAAMLSLVLVFGAYMLVDGIFAIVAAALAAQHHQRWGWLIFEGLADIAAGSVAFAWPAIALLVFVTLLAAWAIISGVFAFGAAFRLRMDHGRIWLLLGAIASIIFGILLLVAPLIGAVVVTWWIGAYGLIFGISLLMLALRLRSHRHDTIEDRGMRHA